MKLLRFISTFIQIVVRGCMGSRSAKAAILTAVAIASVIFVPYLLGLIIATDLPIGIIWLLGLLIITCIIAVVSVINLIYKTIRDEVIE